VLDREGGKTHNRYQHVDGDHRSDRAEEAPRQFFRIAALLGEIGNSLDARESQHRQWESEGERAPTRRTAEVHARGKAVPGEEHRHTQDDQHELGDEVERGENDAEAIDLGRKARRIKVSASTRPTATSESTGKLRIIEMLKAAPR